MGMILDELRKLVKITKNLKTTKTQLKDDLKTEMAEIVVLPVL